MEERWKELKERVRLNTWLGERRPGETPAGRGRRGVRVCIGHLTPVLEGEVLEVNQELEESRGFRRMGEEVRRMTASLLLEIWGKLGSEGGWERDSKRRGEQKQIPVLETIEEGWECDRCRDCLGARRKTGWEGGGMVELERRPRMEIKEKAWKRRREEVDCVQETRRKRLK